MRTERRQSRTDLPTGYVGVPVLKTDWATGPGRSASHDRQPTHPSLGARAVTVFAISQKVSPEPGV